MRSFATLGIVVLGWLAFTAAAHGQEDHAAHCEAMIDTRNLTLYRAEWRAASESSPAYCHVQGQVGPGLTWYVQMPPPEAWNGRFLNWGDGGHDGDLDYAPHRVAEGYAVANGNMGHDNGSQPGATFAFNDRQAEVVYGYGHIKATTDAAKTAIRAFYGRPAEYSYHEGCSTGGRQGLMAAQRWPSIFDGIVAGAPASFLQRLNVTHNWDMQVMLRDDYSGSLSYDTDDNGTLDSLTKANMLTEAVLAQCDANDGIVDRVVNNPETCDFVPERDLAHAMCVDDVNADDCFTTTQLAAIQAIYSGPYDSAGTSIYKGKSYGSEMRWPLIVVPHEGNNHRPGQIGLASDYVNFLFYDNDPGVPTTRPTDLSLAPDPTREPPEFAWWQFDFDDFTAGLGDTMRAITDADDPNMSRYLKQEGGKLLIWHGWADTVIPAQPMVDFYGEVVDVTFDGDRAASDESVRLFMPPGVAHCAGGPGPDSWDRLAPIVEWVENGTPPDSLTVQKLDDGAVVNERLVCPYPEQAVYVGGGDANDPANWVAGNFVCE